MEIGDRLVLDRESEESQRLVLEVDDAPAYWNTPVVIFTPGTAVRNWSASREATEVPVALLMIVEQHLGPSRKADPETVPFKISGPWPSHKLEGFLTGVLARLGVSA